MHRDEVREACWLMSSQRASDGNAQPWEAIAALARTDPEAFWRHLLALIADAGTTDEASYLYRDGLRALVAIGGQWEAAVRDSSRESARVASVVYDAFQFDDQAAVARILDRELLVRTWIKYTVEQRTDADEFWAWNAAVDAVSGPLDEFWSLILELLAAAPNDHVVEMIGVGPIEDWIGGGWEDGVRRIEEEAPSNARLRQALAGIWIDGIPEEFFQRNERAAGVTLSRFQR